ncbi:MAG: type II secretion system protein [Pedosphaera sp.]|nr:type II secretion system protein [Pedosphaera sp.]
MKTKLNLRRSGRNSGAAGFTLTELMIVVGILGLLSVMAFPSYGRARDSARLNAIYNNLRQIETAKNLWALEHMKAEGTPIGDLSELKDYFRGGKVNDVTHEYYVVNPVGTPAGASLPTGVALGQYAPGAFIPAQ